MKLTPEALERAQNSAEACDCAPTPDEKRSFWGPVTRRGALAVGALGVIGLGAFGAIRGASPAAAITYNPEDYPSWDDVERARQNESAKASEVTRIEGLIEELKASVAAAQEAARKAADEYYAAQQEYYEAAYRAEELQKQADDQAKKATEAAEAAAKVASQLSRSSGESTPYELLFAESAGDADELLSKLGQMDKLAQRNDSIYAGAVAARDSAQLLSDQAEDARTERDRLQKVAEEKMVAAQEAQRKAEQVLADQKSHLITLEEQLAALKDNTSKTVSDYEKGEKRRKAYEEEQRRLEEERRRREEEERRRREEEERRRREQEEQDNGGGGQPAAPAPPPAPEAPTSSGWVRPSSGMRTSGYGWRVSQCGPSYCSSSFHGGVDLAAGCGAGIYAASSGTVSWAGYNGGYGNHVRIEHGGGIATSYSHIVDGGIVVGNGQYVEAGQLIAYEGNTGNSFGCHLHFEVYVGGPTVDPAPFMASKGVSV
ncbi:peptidoglycan DD-metalloendopeptidase family protein [Microbacterium sp. G2-8]|uniref:peptidoglycan DD-metalloendopeptidase family protein n=1 Tax=Microbacterium sp. G2-8 TaxID=2842454 RepID=UPI0027E35998|nr:peptidoglycan DD-metalloendopeptidase family protein [Microbacterium sp. G2-8]